MSRSSALLCMFAVISTATCLAASRPTPALGIPCPTDCDEGGKKWNNPLDLCNTGVPVFYECCAPESQRGWFGKSKPLGPYFTSTCCPLDEVATWDSSKSNLECEEPGDPPCSPGGLEPCDGDL